MEPDDIAAVVDGFAAAARLGRRGRLRRRRGQRRPAQPRAPVPVRPHQPARRRVGHGSAPLRPRRAGRGARRRVGADRVLGLRLSCDELAPWAGITPEQAPGIAAALAELRRLPRRRARLDLLGRARPGPTSTSRPASTSTLTAAVARRASPTGSRGPAGLGRRRRPGRVGGRRRRRRRRRDDPRPDRRPRPRRASWPRRRPSAIRPCIRCNQTCQVRDARNPIVTLRRRADDRSRDGPTPTGTRPRPTPRSVLVVGGGPAGLEARGWPPGGPSGPAASSGLDRRRRRGRRDAAPAAPSSPGWPPSAGASASPSRRGTTSAPPTSLPSTDGDVVVLAPAAGPGTRDYDGRARRGRARRPRRRRCRIGALRAGPIVVWDPIGGPIGVARRRGARRRRRRSSPPTPSPATSCPAPATWPRPTSASSKRGVRIERRSILLAVRAGEVEVEDRCQRRPVDRSPAGPWSTAAPAARRLAVEAAGCVHRRSATRRPAHDPRGRARRPPRR